VKATGNSTPYKADWTNVQALSSTISLMPLMARTAVIKAEMIPAMILPTLTTPRVDIRVHFKVSLYYYYIPTLDVGKDCGTVQPANVISTSYGTNEADLSVAYSIRQCNEYAKLGLMGVTFLFGSGDRGVAGGGALCLNAEGSANTLNTVATLLAN
jgi:hypothetical protein